MKRIRTYNIILFYLSFYHKCETDAIVENHNPKTRTCGHKGGENLSTAECGFERGNGWFLNCKWSDSPYEILASLEIRIWVVGKILMEIGSELCSKIARTYKIMFEVEPGIYLSVLGDHQQ